MIYPSLPWKVGIKHGALMYVAPMSVGRSDGSDKFVRADEWMEEYPDLYV